jgi:predicted nucleic acid-binding protein
LPIDIDVAEKWGMISANSKKIGKVMSVADSLIAATALVHNLKIVTRNTKDFADINILEVINPWL